MRDATSEHGMILIGAVKNWVEKLFLSPYNCYQIFLSHHLFIRLFCS